MSNEETNKGYHGHCGANLAARDFFIRKMDTTHQIKASEIPATSLPMVGFCYLIQGEMLVEAEGRQMLFSPGHFLLVPASTPFSIKYYDKAVGYTGGFSLSILPDQRKIAPLVKPLHQAFWFDEAVFIGELLNMLVLSFRKDDNVFIEKGLDLLLSRVSESTAGILPPLVAEFIDRIFDRSKPLMGVSGYSSALGVSANYLNRIVKESTRHSASGWIDISRINLAKSLLRNPGMPVIDVAAATGLEDQSYFSRFFKRHTGLTPSEFRSKMTDMHE